MHYLKMLVILLLFDLCANGQRLNSSIQPLHYDLVLLPYVFGDLHRLCGHIFIDIQPQVTTSDLVLHGVDVSILDTSITPFLEGENNHRFQVVEELCLSGLFVENSDQIDFVNYYDDKEQIHIKFKEPMSGGTKYRVGLFYLAKVNDETIKGFFQINYKNDSSSCCHLGSFAGTQMQAIHARKVLPCFDEPAFKTTFDITLGHHKSLSAISNMPESDTRLMTSNHDWIWTKFEKTPPMSTYLLAMFVTDYKYVERIYKTRNRSVRLRFWGRREEIPYLNHTIQVLPDILRYLEAYVRQPYTLQKLDLIGSPKKTGFYAMENWGLLFFHKERLYYNPEDNTEKGKANVVVTVVHELAHQFFGNLVTSDWWDDIWFNEGFPKLLELDVIQNVFSRYEYYLEQTWVEGIQNIMKSDGMTKSTSIIRAVETSEEAENVFDSLTYCKGGALLFMLRSFVGQKNFRNAIVTYMERYRFKATNSRSFMEILDEKVHQNHDIGRGMNITTIMESWTTQPGFPIISCTRSEVGGRIKLSQTPFPSIDSSLTVQTNVSSSNASWWIPISVTDVRRPDFSPTGSTPRLWLTPDRPSIDIPYFPVSVDAKNTWIIINSQRSTYARVLYDEANWKLIARQLRENYTVVPQMTRAQLIDDAFSFALVDLLDYRVALELAEYLTVVKDDFVEPSILYHLNSMQARTIKNASLQLLLESYVGRVMIEPEKLRDENLLSRTKDWSDDLGCNNWDSGLCVDKTIRLFHDLLDDTIYFDERRIVTEDLERHFCVAIRSGGKTEWMAAWKASISDRWVTHRTQILSAMTCSRDRSRLKQLISRIFDSAIDQDQKDTFTIIEKIAENPLGRPMALNFIKTNWNFFDRYFRKSGDSLKLLEAVTKHVSTADELEEVYKVIMSRQDKTKNLNRSIINAILENIRQNIDWVERQSPKVYHLLDAKHGNNLS